MNVIYEQQSRKRFSEYLIAKYDRIKVLNLKIPRPPNSFVVFRMFNRLAGVNCGLPFKQQAVNDSIVWKSLVKEERKFVLALTRDAAHIHKHHFPNYTFSPRQVPTKKRKKHRSVNKKRHRSTKKRCIKVSQKTHVATQPRPPWQLPSVELGKQLAMLCGECGVLFPP